MMKFNLIRFIVLLICWVSGSYLSYAKVGQYRFNNFNAKDAEMEPFSLDISNSPLKKETTIIFKLNYLDIMQNISNYPLELVRINGFGINMENSRPCLPEKALLFAIQQKYECDIEIVSCKTEEIPCNISVSNAPNICEQMCSDSIIAELSDYEGYNYETPLSYSDIQTYRGRHIHRFILTPVAYNKERKIIKVWTEFSAKIKWKTEDKNYLNYSTCFNNFTNETLVGLNIHNHSGGDNFTKSSIPYDEDIAIITTLEAYGGLSEFISWKETLGYNVHVFLNKLWSPEEIKEKCKECYESLDNLTNIILVGDIDNVNSDILFNYDYISLNDIGGGIAPYWDDNRYACMDGEEDYLPDFFISRIPFSSEEDVAQFCAKVINYEKGEYVDDFYKSHAVCSVFESSEKDKNEEQYRFIKGTEDIASYGELLGNDFERLYSCPEGVYPVRFSSNPLFGNNENIPTFLQKPNFLWDKNKFDLIKTFNKGISTFTYSYHGFSEHWKFGGNNGFKINDISLFDNSTHPIVFSMACKTGDLSVNNCLAAELERGAYGAVGVFASTAISYTIFNDALINGIYDAIWDDPGLNPWIGLYSPSPSHYSQTQRRISDILTYSFFALFNKIPAGSFNELHYNKYHRLIYHYFGDATMSVYSKKPEKSKGYFINATDNGFSLKLLDSTPKIVAIKEKTTNKITRFYGNEINYENFTDTIIQVCINGKDIAPTISTIRPFDLPHQIKNPGISSCIYNKSTRIADVSLWITGSYNKIELLINSLSSASQVNPQISLFGKRASIDFSGCPNGIYSIILIVDNKISDNYNLVVG